MADEQTVDVVLKVSVSEADGYGGAHAAGDTVTLPADVAAGLVAAGAAEPAGTAAAEKPAEDAPAESGGATGARSAPERRRAP